jgi:hypothetical protein
MNEISDEIEFRFAKDQRCCKIIHIAQSWLQTKFVKEMNQGFKSDQHYCIVWIVTTILSC